MENVNVGTIITFYGVFSDCFTSYVLVVVRTIKYIGRVGLRVVYVWDGSARKISAVFGRSDTKLHPYTRTNILHPPTVVLNPSTQLSPVHSSTTSPRDQSRHGTAFTL